MGKFPNKDGGICPECKRYGGRLRHDGWCQRCGWSKKSTKKHSSITISTHGLFQVDKLYIDGIEQIEGVDYTVDQERGVINLIDVRKKEEAK